MKLVKVECMSTSVYRNGTIVQQKCRRPVQYVYVGADGKPFYRCGKCGNALMHMRDDIEVEVYDK